MASRDGRPLFPDVVLSLSGRFYYLECKWKKSGWRSLYEIIEKGADGIVLKADYRPLLLVIPFSWFIELLSLKEKEVSNLREKVSDFIECPSCGKEIWDNPYNWVLCPFCGVFSDGKEHRRNGTESKKSRENKRN